MTKRRIGLVSLWGLLLVAFLVRIFYFAGSTLPFSFDHGKDALAVMDLVLNFTPKFVGPWTSIPGLFFGPAWYYLLAPAYLVSGFNPVGAGVLMVLLVLLQVYLAWKYLGTLEALMISCAPFWLIISQSAWNPFPMTLISLVILILLKEAGRRSWLVPKLAGGLGVAAGLGFHFSAAFAIFYPIIILVILLIRKTKISLKAAAVGIAAFGLTFAPQLLFEIKNHFIETKAVIAYFHQNSTQDFSSGKIMAVISETWGILKISIVPELRGQASWLNELFIIGVFGLVIWGCFRQLKRPKERQFIIENILFIVIPVVGFFWLHFNVWYVYALAPVMVVLAGRAFRMVSRPCVYLYVLLILITPLAAYHYYFTVDQPINQQDHAFLPLKLKALQYVRDQAGNRPFASYQYERQIYDYDYQYLYFMQAVQGLPLPTEFSYQPGESIYVTQKQALLKHFHQPAIQPELIFYIMEKPLVPALLSNWWDKQQHGAITATYELSPEVTIYTAEAK